MKNKLSTKLSGFDTSNHILVSSNEFEEFSYGIDEEDMPFIMMTLREKIYSDPIKAVIREYSTNAVDAHIDAGIPNMPITVMLPTSIEPVFSIRDFGKGLTKGEIRTLYIRFGKSMSRSNMAKTGALGFGCKSGFAYSDSFVVISFKDGMKSVYLAQVDQDNIPKCIVLEESPSSEPDGIEIRIDVRKSDISAFISKAFDIYRYFDIYPNIIYDASVLDKYKKPNALLSTVNCQIFDRANSVSSTVAIMGNIAYEISTVAFSVQLSEEERLVLSSNYLALCFKNGELDFDTSRERLGYTERTMTSLRDKIKIVSDEIVQCLNLQIESCSTLWDANIKAKNILCSFSSSLQDTFWYKLRWTSRLENVKYGLWEKISFYNSNILLYRYSYSHSLRKYNKKRVYNVLNIDANTYLAEVMFDDVKQITSRLDTIVQQQHIDRNVDIYVMIYDINEKKQFLHQKYHLNECYGDYFYDLSKVLPYKDPKIDRSYRRTKKDNVISRIKIPAFTLRHYSQDSSLSSYWEDHHYLEFDNVSKEYVYLPIYQYKIVSIGQCDLTKIVIGGKLPIETKYTTKNISNLLGYITSIEPDCVIYGIRAKDIPQLGKNWISFEHKIGLLCLKIIQDLKFQEGLSLYKASLEYESRFDFDSRVHYAKHLYVDFLKQISQSSSIAQYIRLLMTIKEYIFTPEIQHRYNILVFSDEHFNTSFCSIIDRTQIIKLRRIIRQEYPNIEYALSKIEIDNKKIVNNEIEYINSKYMMSISKLENNRWLLI